MTSDMPSPAAPPGPETPPASLTMVRVSRRSTAPASRKRGDLTQQLLGDKAGASSTKPNGAKAAAGPSVAEQERSGLFADRKSKKAKRSPEPAASPEEPTAPCCATPDKEPIAAAPVLAPPLEKAKPAGNAAAPEPVILLPPPQAIVAPEGEAVAVDEPPAPPAAAQPHATPFLAGLKVLRKLIKPSAWPIAAAVEPKPTAAPDASEPLPPSAVPPEAAEPELILLPAPEPIAPEVEAAAPPLPLPEEPKRRITADRFGTGSTAAPPAETAPDREPLVASRFTDDPPAAEPPPEATAPEDASPSDAIIDYWDSLRGGRDFPSLDQLDRALIAESWPNSVLLSFPASQPDMPRIARLGEPDGEVEYNAMVTEWILSRGRHSAKRGRPMEEEQRFPVASGSARYRLLLLPFSGGSAQSDHVLCHVSRTEELSTVASFKRWLAL